jgi:hypothetical protein
MSTRTVFDNARHHESLVGYEPCTESYVSRSLHAHSVLCAVALRSICGAVEKGIYCLLSLNVNEAQLLSAA